MISMSMLAVGNDERGKDEDEHGDQEEHQRDRHLRRELVDLRCQRIVTRLACKLCLRFEDA